MTNGLTAEVIGQLRANAVAFEKSAVCSQIVRPRDEVLSRFQPIFSTDHIPTLSADEGGARRVVGIWRGAISGNMNVSFQAARSIG